MIPWHPMLVHFPIALTLMALVFALIGGRSLDSDWYKAAVRLSRIAALCCWPAVIAGLLEAQRLGIHHPVVDNHRNAALVLTGFLNIGVSIHWFLSRKAGQYAGWFLIGMLTVAAALTLTTGYWGGRMVYEYGLGVAH